MKKLILAAVCFAALSMALDSCGSSRQTEAVETKSALDVIHERASVRAYTDREVTREQLETILRAGMAAPSAMDKRPWYFVVIQDKETLNALGENMRTSKVVQGAAAAIIVCGNTKKAGESWLQQYWVQDCSAVSQNILLAITDMGLGGVWTSVYPARERIEIVADVLNLPEHIIPLNIIPLGYPAGENAPKDKWDAANIQWGVFE